MESKSHIFRNMKTNAFVFYALIIFSSWASAQNAGPLLERDILVSTKILDRDIKLYHYFNAPTVTQDGKTTLHPQLQTADGRVNWLKYLLEVRAGVFWDFNYFVTSYINAGPGMYFALDPDSSKEFGNSAIILTAPKNSKFLNVFKNVKINKDTIEALLTENVVSKNQLIINDNTLGLNSGISRMTLKNMVRPENVEFRKLFSSVLQKNNIQLIEYEYKSHLAGFCKVSSQSAFVFIGAGKATAPSSNNEVAAVLTPDFLKYNLISSLEVTNPTQQEAHTIDLTNRFKYVLSEIRKQGTGTAAQKLIKTNLSESEIDELASQSYECTRRY